MKQSHSPRGVKSHLDRSMYFMMTTFSTMKRIVFEALILNAAHWTYPLTDFKIHISV